jgi:hypothetical protein
MSTTLIHAGAAIASFFMTRKSDRAATAAVILCDARRSPASSQGIDLHDVTGHHRYYGSSARA